MVWAMVIAMGYMAWAMSTPEEAIGRILLGPALGTIMLHLGLGLELRARHQRTGTIARIGRELRERCLSRLGLESIIVGSSETRIIPRAGGTPFVYTPRGVKVEQ